VGCDFILGGGPMYRDDVRLVPTAVSPDLSKISFSLTVGRQNTSTFEQEYSIDLQTRQVDSPPEAGISVAIPL